ncbi:MAG: hypothetical protein ABIE70_08715 [bacterium]
MKFYRIGIALLLTAVMLYTARNTSRGRPEEISRTDNGYTFEFSTVPKGIEFTATEIALNVTGPFEEGTQVVMRLKMPSNDFPDRLDGYAVYRMIPSQEIPGRFETEIRSGAKGGRTYYYFEVRDQANTVLARFTDEDKQPWVFKYFGEVPPLVLLGHIFLMFATVFCVVMGAVHGADVVKTGSGARVMARWITLAAVASFLGGYPFGFAMNYFAFGVVWEGVPFGTDATDNKTQLLFLYFVFVVAAAWGSLSNGKWGRDAFSQGMLGRLGIGALILQVLIYLIPHSIQFSKGLTYGVGYGFPALLLVWYLIGRTGSARRIQ